MHLLPMSWLDPRDQHLSESSGVLTIVLMQEMRPWLKGHWLSHKHVPYREKRESHADNRGGGSDEKTRIVWPP